MEQDIIDRLSLRISATQDAGDRQLLLDAIEAIETLRALVGIRREMEIEGMEPDGHA